MKSRGVDDGWCSGCARYAVLGIVLLSMLNFYIMTHILDVLDVVTDVDVDVDALTNIVWWELINLLVAVITSAARWARGHPS